MILTNLFFLIQEAVNGSSSGYGRRNLHLQRRGDSSNGNININNKSKGGR